MKWIIKLLVLSLIFIVSAFDTKGQYGADLGDGLMWFSGRSMSSPWRLPTKAEWETILKTCKWEWDGENDCYKVYNGADCLVLHANIHSTGNTDFMKHFGYYPFSTTNSTGATWYLHFQSAESLWGKYCSLDISAYMTTDKPGRLNQYSSYCYVCPKGQNYDEWRKQEEKNNAIQAEYNTMLEQHFARLKAWRDANDKPYVDLGLPSGTLWATCNVGASIPESTGNLYEWGETEVRKALIDLKSNKYFFSTGSGLKKYNTKESYGIVDNLTILNPSDDAATVNMGEEWRMPTREDFDELIENCDMYRNPRTGDVFFCSKKHPDVHIILPYYQVPDLKPAGPYYWTSTLWKDKPKTAIAFYCFYKDIGDDIWAYNTSRYIKLPIRAVRRNPNSQSEIRMKAEMDALAQAKEKIEDRAYAMMENQCINYVDLGLPSGTLWAECNVGSSNYLEPGELFAWGETLPKKEYKYNTYKYGGGDSEFSKYNELDRKYILDPSDDAATVYMGADWRMPTKAEWEELLSYCTKEAYKNGVAIRSKANPRRYILLPYSPSGSWTYFWSAERDTRENYRFEVSVENNAIRVRSGNRCDGYYVRGVLKNKNAVADIDEATSIYFATLRAEGKATDTAALLRKNMKQIKFDMTRSFDEYVKEVANTSTPFVDLGLPSGTKWAICNIGANNFWESGDRFAWGETAAKSTNSWTTYKYANGNEKQLTKYCSISKYGNNGFTDGNIHDAIILERSDDAAIAQLGNNWRTPTKIDFQELLDNCIIQRIRLQDKLGYLLTSKLNGKRIFIPDSSPSGGFYWTSSLYMDEPSMATILHFKPSIEPSLNYCSERRLIYPIRPVWRDDPMVAEKTMVEAAVAGKAAEEKAAEEKAAAEKAAAERAAAERAAAKKTAEEKAAAEKARFPTVLSNPTAQYVDLGLPSGTKWATCNVGAQNPWEYGGYFAWGETTVGENCSYENYKYANGGPFKITKYCKNFLDSDNGVADYKTVLDRSDDAATANWGKDWCMPTYAQFKELYENCTSEWTTNYGGKGVAGRLFKSRKNGNTIFFPASGKDRRGIGQIGEDGIYWSSSLDSSTRAISFGFDSSQVIPNYSQDRFDGLAVRPVRSKN